MPEQMTELAWAAIITPEGLYTLGLAEKGIRGYIPLIEQPWFDSYGEASTEAKVRNVARGLTLLEAAKIVASSMNADPKHVYMVEEGPVGYGGYDHAVADENGDIIAICRSVEQAETVADALNGEGR